MELFSFIKTHREAILADWEQDARRRAVSGLPGDIRQLRDNLGEVLETIARDLEQRQRPHKMPTELAAPHLSEHRIEAAAEEHGAERAEQGERAAQVVLEFPILRRSVTRLWRRSQIGATTADLDSLIDFDEAIDRALTTSIAEYTHRIDQTRETLLGILGQDLRDPLTTIIEAGARLAQGGIDEDATSDIGHRIVSTGERLHYVVVNLLDATRMRFGGRFPIERRKVDLEESVRAVAEEFAAAHPDRAVDVTATGALRGVWDDRRLGQAVASLLANAAQHGREHTPIHVSMAADHEITIAVHNVGPAIPEERRSALFEPWGNITHRDAAARSAGHIGLGLYIASAIVKAHGGYVDVESNKDRGTTFTIHLPATLQRTTDRGKISA